MRLRSGSIFAALVAYLSLMPSAGAQVFTNRTAFETALGVVTRETFESTPLVGDIDSGAASSVALADFTASSTPPAVKIVATPDGFGSTNTTPAGTRYLYLDTDQGLQGSATTLSFNTAKRGVGFDYTGVTEPGTTFTVTINSQVFSLTPNPNNSTPRFWGFISGSGNVASAVLTTSLDSGYGVDDVTYAIPEPASALSVAFASCVFIRRRRR
jgi:hypothetical protein